jgi:hypothetical protein
MLRVLEGEWTSWKEDLKRTGLTLEESSSEKNSYKAYKIWTLGEYASKFHLRVSVDSLSTFKPVCNSISSFNNFSSERARQQFANDEKAVKYLERVVRARLADQTNLDTTVRILLRPNQRTGSLVTLPELLKIMSVAYEEVMGEPMLSPEYVTNTYDQDEKGRMHIYLFFNDALDNLPSGPLTEQQLRQVEEIRTRYAELMLP